MDTNQLLRNAYTRFTKFNKLEKTIIVLGLLTVVGTKPALSAYRQVQRDAERQEIIKNSRNPEAIKAIFDESDNFLKNGRKQEKKNKTIRIRITIRK